MMGKDTAVIFDIRRFSTHDGNGIRTNIFFKGCPLRCVWCQNPEGLETTVRPVYFESKCIGCGICAKTAQNGGVYIEKGKIYIRRNYEDRWDQIIKNCPSGAIRMDAQEYTVEELIEEVMKDKVFFRDTGGVTISGGEPLMQGKFAVELLKELKKQGIHTAVETALHVPSDILISAVPWLDQIHADLKMIDPGEHRKYTAVSNAQILQNLRWLLNSEYRERVIIRTPLIPGMTAVEENLAGIAEFLSGIYPEVHYELLNYNPLAEAKYHLVDKEYCFKDNPKMYSREQMQEFGRIVTRHGIKNLIIEI